MTYRVTRAFFDRQDEMHLYQIGDTYPRSGFVTNEKRIAELAGRRNRLRMRLIEAVAETAEEPKPEETVAQNKPVRKAKKTK